MDTTTLIPATRPEFDVTVIVATFGSDDWARRGRDTADRVAASHGVPVVRVHADVLHTARNYGADLAPGVWRCFLDADDDLEVGYFDAMAHAARRHGPHTLLAPAVRYCYPDGVLVTESFADRDITHLNPCVIGTVVHYDLFVAAGGFLDEAMYEDWSLWLRCVAHGATIEHVAAAVYAATVNPDGRNSGDAQTRRQWYRYVQRRYAGSVTR